MKAKKSLPGGETRAVAYFEPYPLFIRDAKGSRLHDLDGNTYIDFLNHYTSLIHGHAYPKIVEAVKRCVEKGWVFATNIERQYELGDIICERFNSIKKVRFCNSGTEATMLAIQVARAFTRKNNVYWPGS